MDAFIGEIRAFAFTYCPDGWLYCDGSLQLIAQYQALFAVIGLTYGGNGQTNFQLPDMRGQVVPGAGYAPGLMAWRLDQHLGEEAITLSEAQTPVHNHGVLAKMQTTAPSNHMRNNPADTYYLSRLNRTPSAAGAAYAKPPISGTVEMDYRSIGPAGAGEAHENRQPYLPLLFCINYDGAFPPRP